MNRAFPNNERLPWFWLRLKSLFHHAEFLAFFKDHQFVGFTYLLNDKSNHYILYLAVNDQVRSRGYGSQILTQIKAKYVDDILMLSIEDPTIVSNNQSQRQARLKFYQRNGFDSVGHYLQNGDRYLVMATGHYDSSAMIKLINWLAWPFTRLI